MEKTFNNAMLTLGAFLLAAVVGIGITSLRNGSWIDYAPKEWLSDEDREALKNPEAAQKKSMEKFNREMQLNPPKTYNYQNDPLRGTNVTPPAFRK